MGVGWFCWDGGWIGWVDWVVTMAVRDATAEFAVCILVAHVVCRVEVYRCRIGGHVPVVATKRK